MPSQGFADEKKGVGNPTWCGLPLVGQDSLGFEAGDANLYRYVGNDPTDAVDPTGLLKVTAKSVPWPQTGYYEGNFYFYWGVALYIDDAGLKDLARADAPGGYIVSKRKITWKIGNSAEKSETTWHLNQIILKDGKLVPNEDFSTNAGGAGGPRSMAGGSTALTYFSVINTPANEKGRPKGYSDKNGKVSVELTWQLYKGAPDTAIKDKFPSVGRDRDHIGSDECVHTKWTSKDPGIKGKSLADGKVDATITWNATGDDTFSSSNKDIVSGPDRPMGKPFFRGWEYKDGKWAKR